MDNKPIKSELASTELSFPEIHIDDPEELPPNIITVVPNDLPNQNALAGNVPLFIKKLRKMVNDDNAEEIISWNSNGDGFVIHDQLKFVSHTLPKYFKHNNLSSFVRQLNLYDFHKTQNVEKEEFQFCHPFFLKEVPQLLPLIKRKPPSGRQKATTTSNSDQSPEVQEVMNSVEEIKTKSDEITNEMSKLRQENAALWGEINSLRVKYSKQTKIINKLIHFLISYMQKHHHARKAGRTVSTNNANKYLKTGPKIMELDYRYKNNPHEFWMEYDNENKGNEQGEQEAYTVVEPTETNMELDTQAQNNDMSHNIAFSSAIEELFPGSSTFNQDSGSPVDPKLPQIDYAASQPSSSKRSNSALQRAGGSKENLGYFIDNTQVELNTIKELLKNLTPEEMASFYKLVGDNYKNQEDDVPLEISPTASDQLTENELNQLTQMSSLNTIVPEQDLPILFETVENIEDLNIPLETNENIQNLVLPSETDESALNLQTVQNALSSPQGESLDQDNILNDISVDRFFN